MISTKNFYDIFMNISISINKSIQQIMKRLFNEKNELEYYKIRKPLSACADKKLNFFQLNSFMDYIKLHLLNVF